MSCAEGVQLSLHAPKGWKIGFPLYFSHPPAPLPEEMRRGKLNEYNTKFSKTSVAKHAIIDNSVLSKLDYFASLVEKDTISTISVKQPDNSINSNSIAVNEVSVESPEDDNIPVPAAANDDINEVEVAQLLLNRKRIAEKSVDADVAIAAAASRKSRHIQISFGLSDSEED